MSAHDQIRQMLNNLMGTGRNGEDIRKEIHFSDQRVCKNFLLYCCPHEILNSTRYDIGECPKFHSLALRADYEEASKGNDIDFHTEALQNLKSFLTESERRKQIAKKRLASSQQILTAEETEKLNKIYKIVEQIGESLAKAEKLGVEGKVEETVEVMKSIEELCNQKKDAEKELKNSAPASFGQQRKLRVCDICSAYLGLDDNDERLADHFNGRLHMGFVKLFEKVKELEEIIQESHIKKILDKEFGSNKIETTPEGTKSGFKRNVPMYHPSSKGHSESSTLDQKCRKYNKTPESSTSFDEETHISVENDGEESSPESLGTKRKRSHLHP